MGLYSHTAVPPGQLRRLFSPISWYNHQLNCDSLRVICQPQSQVHTDISTLTQCTVYKHICFCWHWNHYRYKGKDSNRSIAVNNNNNSNDYGFESLLEDETEKLGYVICYFRSHSLKRYSELKMAYRKRIMQGYKYIFAKSWTKAANLLV